MSCSIESTLPFPGKVRKTKEPKPEKYPFSKMKIGDSLFIELEAHYRIRQHRKVQSQLTLARNRLGYRFSYRNSETGIRIWRTA